MLKLHFLDEPEMQRLISAINICWKFLPLEVPEGARYVAISGSETAENPRGIMVEVHWEHNDSGALCISGYTTEMPVPPNVQPSHILPVAHSRSLGKSRRIVGRVIDPYQVPTVLNSLPFISKFMICSTIVKQHIFFKG